MDYTTIGKNLRKYRLERNLKQEQLAELVDLSPNYYAAIERGEKIPSLETFICILNALEVSSDLVLSDVLKTGYHAKNSALDDQLKNLPASERARIYAVIDTLLKHAGDR